jgi:hypothetical protein
VSHPDEEPTLTDAEEQEFRDSQADYDSHLHDTDDQEEGDE